jgi:glucoamylase
MKNLSFPRRAAGGPGIEPRWTHGAKLAVGTAYSTSSRVWYTHDAGCVTEVYYPTVDTPQIRDLQFLFTDGETFFHDERRNFTSEIDCITEAALGFGIVQDSATRHSAAYVREHVDVRRVVDCPG